MKPSEQYEFAREVYRYINANPLVSRGIMNSHFRTSSDDRRNRQLSDALDALLARLYIFKYHDEGTAQIFFWTAEFKDSPYEPDDEPILDYTPVDVFGPVPVDPAPPAPAVPQPFVAATAEPEEEEQEEKPSLPENSPEFKAMMKTYESTKGIFRELYEVMMREPTAIYSKTDKAFAHVTEDPMKRSMFLGRMFGLGIIKRLKDLKDPSVAYYTICGKCPESLVEDTIQLSKAAQRRQARAKEAAERQEQINSINQGLKDRAQAGKTEDAEEEQEGEDLDGNPKVDEEEPHSPEPDETEEVTEGQEEEEQEQVEPACYLSNTGELFIRRKDNSTVDLDAEESVAVLETFMMLNPTALERLLAKHQAKKEQASE